MHPDFSKPSLVGLSAFILGLVASFCVSVAMAGTLPDIQRLMKKGQLPQALQNVDAYISSQAKDAQGPFLKGLILTEMGRPVDAIAVFAQLTEDYPELPEPYNNLAVLYAQQKQYDKSRIALEMAIRTHPSYSVAHENLGDIYAKLASLSYDKALQRDSTNTVTQSQLSMIHELGGSVGRNVSSGTLKPDLNSSLTQVVPPSTHPRNTSVEGGPRAPEVSMAKSAPVNPVALESSSGELEITRMLEHWSSAWAQQDIKSALGYTISDLMCRLMREKISSPDLLNSAARISGSTGLTGCRSELRRSRFW